jgi:hypothetical protein
MSEYLFIKSCAFLTSVTSTKTLPAKEVVYIPNGIEKNDLEGFKGYINETVDYSKLGIIKQNYILFACVRLGLHHLLSAYKKLNTDIQLVIVGNFSHDKEYSNYIDNQVNEINVLNKSNKIISIKKRLPKKIFLS